MAIFYLIREWASADEFKEHQYLSWREASDMPQPFRRDPRMYVSHDMQMMCEDNNFERELTTVRDWLRQRGLVHVCQFPRDFDASADALMRLRDESGWHDAWSSIDAGVRIVFLFKSPVDAVYMKLLWNGPTCG